MILKMIFMSEIQNPPFWNSLPSGETLVFSSKNYMPCGILSIFYIFFDKAGSGVLLPGLR
jgi:hypothetical protein